MLWRTYLPTAFLPPLRRRSIWHLLPTPDLFDVMENIDDVPVSTRGLLDLAGQGEAGHGDDVERETDE